eukprot:10422092-Ditylum_brightwellii.AAC.1
MNVHTAKKIAGWDYVINNDAYGGYLPTIGDITVSLSNLKMFINCLFGSQIIIDLKVKELLTASVLHWYDLYCTFAYNEPKGKFKNMNNNMFISKVNNALSAAGVSYETFEFWEEQ